MMQPLRRRAAARSIRTRRGRGDRRRPTASSPGTARWHEPWMAVMSHYDVIVIGSGAGGGTLVRHLAPSGQARAAARARRLAAARAAELAGPRRLRRQPLRLGGHLVRRARQGVPAAGALLRRRRHEALRRRAVPPARGGLRRAAPLRRDLARVADRATTRWSPTTRSPSSSTRCTARAGRIRPSRPPARRTRSRRSATSRASSSSPTTSRRPATSPSTRPAACRLAESDMPHSHCVRCATCDGFPCLVHAKSDAEVLGVRPALEHPNVTLRDERRGRCGSRRTRRGTRGHRRRRRPRRRARDVHRRRRRRLVRRGEQRAAAARLGDRRASRTGWPTAPARSAATTCSTTARRCSRCRRRRTRRCSRRRSGSTTSTSASSDFEYPLGNIQMVGKSSAEMYRGEKPLQTRLAPERTLDGGRPARGRLLALDGGPPAAREPRHAARRRRASGSATRRTTRCPSSGCCTSSSDCSRQLGMHHDHLVPRHAYLKNEIPVAGCAHQAGTCRFGDRPGHVRARTPTAARTRSTTSTSSTRASSRASAR